MAEFNPDLDVVLMKVEVPDTDLVVCRFSYNGGPVKMGICQVTPRGVFAAKRVTPANWRRVWATVAAHPALYAD